MWVSREGVFPGQGSWLWSPTYLHSDVSSTTVLGKEGISPNLSFSVCKVGILIISIPWASCEDETRERT